MKAQLDRAQLETSNTKADLRILDRERASRGELMAAQEEHTAVKEELENQRKKIADDKSELSELINDAKVKREDLTDVQTQTQAARDQFIYTHTGTYASFHI